MASPNGKNEVVKVTCSTCGKPMYVRAEGVREKNYCKLGCIPTSQRS
jgi:hypothetical protein